MARRRIGKITEVKVDIANYSYMMNGIAGVGKTTTVSEIATQEYGQDGYILLTIGQEPQPSHIGGIYNERAVDWDDLEDIIDTICDYKDEDYPNLRMVGIDSVEEVFRLCEEKVIQLHNRKYPDKKTTTIKSAFGGYQAGENMVVNMVSNTLFKLRDYNISLFFIGHTKTKNKRDDILDVEYEQITSTLDNKYYNCIKDKVNVVMCAYVERQMNDLETVKDAFTKKNKQVGKIASEKRVVSFRDEEYAIDVKSHFKYIDPKCDLDAGTIIKTLKSAIKSEAESRGGKPMTDKQIEDKKKEQFEELEQQVVEQKQKQEDTIEKKQEKLDKIKGNFDNLDMVKLQDIMKEFNIADFTDVEKISTEALDKILELI